MDDEWIIGTLTVLVICIAVVFGLYLLILTPIRNDIAQNKCDSMGFETYVSYDNYFFGVEPKALVCGTMTERLIKERVIKAYSTDGSGNIIVQEVKSS